MKKYLILIVSVVICTLLVCCNCKSKYIEPTNEESSIKSNKRMGYRSIISYKYMPYTADSALININVFERADATSHYTHAEIVTGNDTIGLSDRLPLNVEFPISIIDDSIIVFKHCCWVDTLNQKNYKEPLVYELRVHKGEIVNSNPDTVVSPSYYIILGTETHSGSSNNTK